MATATASKSKLGIRPLNDRIIVRRLQAEEKTAGGIVLPDSAKEKPKQGVVLAVGPGKVNNKGSRTELTVKVDDRVLFSSYAGTEIKIEGDELLILTEDEVLAIVQS